MQTIFVCERFAKYSRHIIQIDYIITNIFNFELEYAMNYI